MDVDRPAASRITGQPSSRADELSNPMWRFIRCPLPKFTGWPTLPGYPELGDYRRSATGEVAS